MSFPDTERRANVLIAFPYWHEDTTRIVTANASKMRLLIDSGAFTAWKAGKPIALDDYCKFIEGMPVEPWRYFTLDVIGDAAGTMRNYEAMLARGFKPMPIFTRGEDASVLEDYYKTSEVVGIGGLVGTQENKGFVNGIMKRVAGRKVHLLGFTNLEYVKFYKPYMCDSSSWQSGPRYGAIRLYMGNGQFIALKKQDFMKQPKQAILDRIQVLGLDPYALRKVDAWHGGMSINYALAASCAVSLSLDVQRNLKTLYFNAVSADQNGKLNLIVEAFDRLTTRGIA